MSVTVYVPNAAPITVELGEQVDLDEGQLRIADSEGNIVAGFTLANIIGYEVETIDIEE